MIRSWAHACAIVLAIASISVSSAQPERTDDQRAAACGVEGVHTARELRAKIVAQAWSIRRDRTGRDGDVILYVGSDTQDDTLSQFECSVGAGAVDGTIAIQVNLPSKAEPSYALRLPVRDGKIDASGIEVLRKPAG